MAAHQDGLGFIDLGGKGRRPPVIGMKFLHEGAMRSRDLFARSPLRKPQDLIGFILGHGSRETLVPAPAPAPRVGVAIACRTPTGKPAVEISL